jgi:hypothetical protein
MRLIEAFTSGWNRSFDYEGRSNRGDYWWFVLANLIVGVLTALISDKLNTVYSLASLVPGIPGRAAPARHRQALALDLSRPHSHRGRHLVDRAVLSTLDRRLSCSQA